MAFDLQRRFCASCTGFMVLSLAGRVHADKPVVQVALETSGYQDTTATSVVTPAVAGNIRSATEGWSVNGRYLVDIVSAASPDIVSTASPRWLEVRNAGSLGGKYMPGSTGGTAAAFVSHTPDYLSLGGTVGIVQDLDEKHWTLSGSYGYQRDTIGRTGTSFRDFSRDLSIHSANLGATRILSPSSWLAVSAEGFFESGDQSKPYRYIPLFSAAAALRVNRAAAGETVNALRLSEKPLEQLPLTRQRLALTARLATRNRYGQTWRQDLRLYSDTWGQLAATTDARFLMDVAPRLRLWPHGRLHYQSPVSFWQRAYVVAPGGTIPGLRTTDRELGQLLNFSAGGGIRWALGPAQDKDQWALSVSADVTWSRFFDALYIGQRMSGLAVVNVEGRFE
jgi:Protein of unknown function (DUF3570)